MTASSLPEGTIDDEPGELSFTQVLLDATVPIPQDEDSFLIAGVAGRRAQRRLRGVPVLADDDLHRYGLRLGYGRFVNDELMVQGYWQPSIYSDLDGTLNSDDYRLYYGTLLAVYQTSPTWFWKAGLARQRRPRHGRDPARRIRLALRGALELPGARCRATRRSSTPTIPGRSPRGLWLEADEYHVRSPESLGLEHDVHVRGDSTRT